MLTSEYEYCEFPFYEFNKAQSAVIPYADKDVNLVISFPTATGKCLHGSTRVLMANGKIKTLLELYNSNNVSYSVISLNEKTLKFDKTSANICRLPHNSNLLNFKFGRGNLLSVTNEHPFLVKRGSLLEWVEAKDINIGDFVVVPNNIDINNKPDLICFENSLKAIKSGYISCPDLMSELILKVNNGIKYGSRNNFSEKFGINKHNIDNWRSGGSVPIKELLKFIKETNSEFNLLSEYLIKGSNTNKTFKIPVKCDKKLARFIGFIIADGSVGKSSVKFHNIDKDLTDEFIKICLDVFNINANELKDYTNNKIVGAKIDFIAFVEFVGSLQIPRYKKSDIVIVPDYMYSQSKEVIGAFLSGLYDCDGNVNNSIEYSSNSEQLVFGMQTLLLKFGIRSTITSKFFKNKFRFRLMVFGSNMITFSKYIKLGIKYKQNKLLEIIKKVSNTNVDIIPYIKEDLKNIKKSHNLKFKDFSRSIESVIYSNRNLSFNKSHEFIKDVYNSSSNIMECDSLERLKRITYSDIRFEKVKERSIGDIEEYVYDLTVPKYHNFIAENVVVHNTAIAEAIFGYHLNKSKDEKCVYTSPYRALSLQKYESWNSDKQFSKHGVVLSSGDSVAKQNDFDSARMLLLTTESFDSKTRNIDAHRWLESVSVLVCDESHLIGHEGRGDKIEVSLMRFTEINPDARIIFLSATMSNASQLSNWIKKLNGKETMKVVTSWRPSKIVTRFCTFEDTNSWENWANKKEVVSSIINDASYGEKIIVFVHSKKFGKELGQMLKKADILCSFHNASLSYKDRQKIENAFSDPYSGLNVLISTSTLSAGVNI